LGADVGGKRVVGIYRRLTTITTAYVTVFVKSVDVLLPLRREPAKRKKRKNKQTKA